MDEKTPPAHLNPLQRFGWDVKQVRLARNLRQKSLGKAVGYSEAYVSRVEAGKLLPKPSEKFAKGCDSVFDTGELFTGLLRRIDEGDHPSWFVPYLNLERQAARILDYSANLFMGILQTEEYARAVFRAAHPREEEAVIDGKVAARIRRREVFEKTTPPSLWVILHEACLRTVVGGAAVMARQLEHLVRCAHSTSIDIQVMPFSAGAPAAYMMPFTLLKFGGSPAVVYSDDPRGGRLYDSDGTVAWALDNYDRLRAHALSPDASLVLIESVSKEYRHEQQRLAPE
ncbi:helix-turn-helix transcriptional regulator [Streptomyces xiamenensis]|uniref:helix-turn-helix domain-containing protein n=1 Tax=Streptomyces xiamenensis TaxID=408015 RepID=UPI0036E8E58F